MIDKITSTIENEDKYKEKVIEITKRLNEQRENFYLPILELVNESSDYEKIPETQVKMLSQRHRLVEYMTNDLNRGMISARSLYDKSKKVSLNQIKTNYDLKLTSDREKTIVTDADTRVFKEMVELFESQMLFVKETIKLLDNLGYSIKNRIDISNYSRGE